jgi:O-antigen/teichoic acid export membrane protein
VGGPLSLAQVSDGVVLSSDVILLRAIAGPVAAGLFSAAQKITAAAEVPSHLLGRLFQPHLHHAAARGDAAATLERTVRASAYVTLPVAVGGWIVAEPLLVRVFGDPAYAEAAWTLRWLLVVTVLMGVGARYSNMLFARREHRAYLAPIVAGTVVNLALTLLLIPRLGSTGTALATAAALLLVAVGSFLLLRARVEFRAAAPFGRPLVVAVAVGAAAWAVPQEWGVLAALAAGALVFAVTVFAFEVRGRWSELGEGLQRGSGFAPGTPADARVSQDDRDRAP